MINTLTVSYRELRIYERYFFTRHLEPSINLLLYKHLQHAYAFSHLLTTTFTIKKKMSTAMKVTPLKDVKPYKSRWKVHVKVLHSWKQYNPVHGDTLEMVLSDEAVSVLIRVLLLVV